MCVFFFFNDTATTEIYTLSLHDALPIWCWLRTRHLCERRGQVGLPPRDVRALAVLPDPHGFYADDPCQERPPDRRDLRSEEHTSELQSRQYLVCRLLLEKKKKVNSTIRQ